MPLYANAEELIRRNLETIHRGDRVKPVIIGALTDLQRDAINVHRLSHNSSLQCIVNEVVFHGAHIYKRRVQADGYTVSDVMDQIRGAMAEDSLFVSATSPMQTLKSIHARADRYGNFSIRDQAIFECTARRPTAELYSVIPKGDFIKPRK